MTTPREVIGSTSSLVLVTILDTLVTIGKPCILALRNGAIYSGEYRGSYEILRKGEASYVVMVRERDTRGVTFVDPAELIAVGAPEYEDA